jgi:large subunit ribosomal protein L10e
MKSHNYRKPKGQAYTRKKYIRGSHQPKITKFSMGDSSKSYDYKVSLISRKRVQIRHNALEASRVTINRLLSSKLGNNYFLRVLPYPHHHLRENKMIFGAHADRLQDGMRGAFGKVIGIAARVKVDQSIVNAYVNENGIDVAKEAMRRGGIKLPLTFLIKTEKVE